MVQAKKEKRLPSVLSLDEVHLLLSSVTTPQNKAYLTIVYSCGLRLTESLHLQVSDIDADRMRIHVHRGKGAKDRYVLLPLKTLKVLRNYWVTHRNPVLIFPALGRGSTAGPTSKTPMTKSTVQGALRRVVKQLGFKKRISVHTLRHSYATHLLEANAGVSDLWMSWSLSEYFYNMFCLLGS